MPEFHANCVLVLHFCGIFGLAQGAKCVTQIIYPWPLPTHLALLPGTKFALGKSEECSNLFVKELPRNS